MGRGTAYSSPLKTCLLGGFLKHPKFEHIHAVHRVHPTSFSRRLVLDVAANVVEDYTVTIHRHAVYVQQVLGHRTDLSRHGSSSLLFGYAEKFSLPEIGDLATVGILVVLAPFEGGTFGDVDNSLEAFLGHDRFGGSTVHHHIHLHELLLANAAD